jgi:hypothetical protein
MLRFFPTLARESKNLGKDAYAAGSLITNVVP